MRDASSMRGGFSDEIRQITFRELLDDPVYRRWFQKKPERRSSQSWRVYAQREEGGPWAKRDFVRWEDAYNFLRSHHHGWYDCSLTSRVWDWRPPVVRFTALEKGKKKFRRRYYEPMVNIVGHLWCPHCRRPTVFRKFARHHNIGMVRVNRERCSICGISLKGIKVYQATEEEDAT